MLESKSSTVYRLENKVGVAVLKEIILSGVNDRLVGGVKMARMKGKPAASSRERCCQQYGFTTEREVRCSVW